MTVTHVLWALCLSLMTTAAHAGDLAQGFPASLYGEYRLYAVKNSDGQFTAYRPEALYERIESLSLSKEKLKLGQAGECEKPDYIPMNMSAFFGPGWAGQLKLDPKLLLKPQEISFDFRVICPSGTLGLGLARITENHLVMTTRQGAYAIFRRH